MDTKQLQRFLVKAKLSTYAAGQEEEVLPDRSKELEYRERELKYRDRELKYRDRYFGFNPFIGEEIIFHNKRAIWGMNYYGVVISEIVSAKQIYRFLQEALKRVTENKPFRGPEYFKGKDFEYVNKIKGSIEKFDGREEIFYKKQRVYILTFHGGLIKPSFS